MPDSITCSNPDCEATIPTADKSVGDTVVCPECGMQNQVLAAFDSQFDISTFEEPAEKGKKMHHPARQVCTNCGALLGVRDAVCPNCGGDVRTGVTVSISKEEKERHGLGAALFKAAGGSEKGASVLMIVLVVLGLAILGVGGLVVYLLTQS